MRKFYFASLAGVSMLAFCAFADENDNPLAGIYACVEIQNDTERLACFDAAVNQTQTAEVSGEFRTLTRADSARVQEDAFGFSLPSLPTLRLPSLGNQTNDLADAVVEAPATAEVPQSDIGTPPTPSDPVPPSEVVELQDEQVIQTAEIAPQPAPEPEPEAPAAPEPAASVATDTPAEERATDVIRNEEGDIQSVTLRIQRINRTPYGRITVYFRNGQVWRQIDSDEDRISRNNPPRTATVRRAAFGSYLMRLENSGRAIRVRREE